MFNVYMFIYIYIYINVCKLTTTQYNDYIIIVCTEYNKINHHLE